MRTSYHNIKVYLAGPIFCYGDYLRSIEWANKIRAAFPGIDLYSPVENTDINGCLLLHISEPTRLLSNSYAVFCLIKKKKKKNTFHL